MSSLYKLLEESEALSEGKNISKSSKKGEEEDYPDMQFDSHNNEEEQFNGSDIQNNEIQPEIDNSENNLSNESHVIHSSQYNEKDSINIPNSNLNGFSINSADNLSNSTIETESIDLEKNSKRDADRNIYPVLSNTFMPKELQIFNYFHFPSDGTVIFLGWEYAIIDCICHECTNMNSIKSFIFGAWFLDSSGHFIQFNYSNISIFLSPEVLEETNIFAIDNKNNTISLTYDISLAKDCNNYTFIFDKNKDLTFNLIVVIEAHKLSEHQDSFSIDDLFTSLNLKTYRTPVNTYDQIIKDDLYRIQYLIDQSPYFNKNENGTYSKSEVLFGSFLASELSSNEAVNVMIKSFPIGHCFYKSELRKIIESNGIQFSEKDIIFNERVFYCSGMFGIRPNFQFKKQSRIRSMTDSNFDILNNIVVRAFSEINQPISIATLFSVIDGKKYFYETGTASTKIINDSNHSYIRSFVKFQPFIFCKNKKYFMIPRSSECDIFGRIYITLIHTFLLKYGNQITEPSILSKFNEIRFPLRTNEAFFTQAIKEAVKEISIFLKIPQINSKVSISNDFSDLFCTNINDGSINKNAFISISSIDEENDKFNQKLKQDSSNDFLKRAKRKKILLDTIPDQQGQKNDDEIDDDFEDDPTISDLEKKLIRLARKYYNPKNLKYSTPSSFVDELIGQKTVNKDEKEFVINNDSEIVELVANELSNSKRFISNKDQKKFCYIGITKNDSNLVIHDSTSNDILIAEDIDGGKNDNENSNSNTDDDEQKDIFSNLNIFNNSSDNQNYSYSESYSASSGEVSDSYIGIDVELNKWDPPKLRTKNLENFDNPLNVIRYEERNLKLEPIQFVPDRLAKVDRKTEIKERLKAIHKSKDHSLPSEQQIFSLFLEFSSNMSIGEFKSYIVEIEGEIFAETH